MSSTRPDDVYKLIYFQLYLTFSYIQMSKQVLIGMLQQGNTGNEILSILDVIAEEENSNQTINEIADLLFD